MVTDFERRKEERKRRRYGLFAALFMSFLMVTLSFGYVQFSDKEDTQGGIEEHGLIFSPLPGGGYTTKFDGTSVSFDLLPSEVSSLPSEDLGLVPGRVYMVYDLESLDISDYVYQRLGAFLSYKGYTLQPACLREEGCGDFPIVSCSEGKQILMFAKDTSSHISRDGSCVVLSYASSEQLHVASLFIYKLLGVL